MQKYALMFIALGAAATVTGCSNEWEERQEQEATSARPDDLNTVGNSGERSTGPGTFDSGSGMSTGTGLDGTGRGVGTTGDVDDTVRVGPANGDTSSPIGTEQGARTGTGSRTVN